MIPKEIQEAFSLLGADENTSEEDLKKKYKDLSKKYHPDLYKEDPEKFKQINAAYQLIKDFKENPNKYIAGPSVGDWTINFTDLNGFFQNMYSGASRTVQPTREDISVSITIDFEESVLGCEKNITYKHHVKCDICAGKSFKQTGNGCKACDGFGRVVSTNKGFTIQTSCNKCFGRNVKKDKCVACNGKGAVEHETAGNIHIRAGITDGTVLRISRGGHYVGNDFFHEHYTDVLIHVKVKAHHLCKIEGVNILSTHHITLLEALTGTDKTVFTFYGDKNIKIKKLTKNGDVIKIPKCGVKNLGDQLVTILVDYPEDTTKLIDVLKNEQL